MILKLTIKQKLEYYAVVGFAMLVPIFIVIEIVKILIGTNNDSKEIRELIFGGLPFVIIALILFLIRKRQLRFKEYRIDSSLDDFNKAVDVSSKQLEWRIQKRTNKKIKALRGPDLLGSEMITIIHFTDKILINCIPNPDFKASILTMGLRKVHFKTFVQNLTSIVNDQEVKELSTKWTQTDFILRLIGYPFCLLFIGLSVFVFIPNGNYFVGILIGLIGILILVVDLIGIFKKSPATNKM